MTINSISYNLSAKFVHIYAYKSIYVNINDNRYITPQPADVTLHEEDSPRRIVALQRE